MVRLGWWRSLPVRSMKLLFPILFSGWFAIMGMLTCVPLVGAIRLVPVDETGAMARTVSHVGPNIWRDWVMLEFPKSLSIKRGYVFSSLNWHSAVEEVIKTLMDVDWNDRRSVVAMELPWMSSDRDLLLWGKNANQIAPMEIDPTNVFADKPPIDKPIKPLRDQTTQSDHQAPLVLIYHSHNRESWLPELPNVVNPDLAFDAKRNITLLGKRMSHQLKIQHIASDQSNTDYPSEVSAFNYRYSYRYSSETIRAEREMYPTIRYFFDIHRDSQRYKETTLKFAGKGYAQVYLIIGKKNPHWEANMAFAKRIHEQLEREIPGLSRGVWGKGDHGNGEYNQSISNQSVLIEIGGVDNTLLECTRTVDVLARAIAKVIRQTEQESE